MLLATCWAQTLYTRRAEFHKFTVSIDIFCQVEAGDDDDVQIGGQEPVHGSETTADTDHISEEDEKEED